MERENEWQIPDHAWEIFDINNQDQYNSKFVVIGKFHSHVPEIIVDEFKSVEYLTVYSFYRIKLYNEAFNKCMRILEIAIKQKAQLLNISFETSTKKPKTLDALINEICSDSRYKDFKSRFNWFRKLRNYEMHPSSEGGILGAFFSHKSKMVFFINTLNEFFQDEQLRTDRNKYSLEIENKITSLGTSNLLLKIDSTIYPISSIIEVKAITTKSGTALIIAYNPVFASSYDLLSQQKYPRPLFLLLHDVTITDESIIGTILENKIVRIYRESTGMFDMLYHEFNKDFDRLSEKDKLTFGMWQELDVGRKIEEIKYDYEFYS